MSENKTGETDLFAWAFAGAIIFAFTPVAEPARDFAWGLLGSATAAQSSQLGPAELQAEIAKPMLSRELEADELAELTGAIRSSLSHDGHKVLPIVGKYALMGEPRAQALIASMYLNGGGLPLDRAEGIRWLRLAAAQGGQAEEQYLIEVMTAISEKAAIAEQGLSHNGSETVRASGGNRYKYLPSFPTQFPQSDLGAGASTPYSAGSTIPDGLSFKPGRIVENTASASRAWLNDNGMSPQRGTSSSGTRLPQIGLPPPVILNRAGPGSYTDSNGDFYTQAGPRGVVNTRTGEFSPTN